MLKLRNHMLWLAVLAPLSLAACDDGPAEDVGEAIDETAEEAGDAAEEATD